MAEVAHALARIAPAEAAPAVALLHDTPPALERDLPLIDRAALDALLPAPALRAVDRLLDTDGDAPPAAGALHAVHGLAPTRPSWFADAALGAWRRLDRAMRTDLGRGPVAASAYRSPTYQALLVLFLWHRHGYDAQRTAAWALAPAQSEHCDPVHHAIDLTTPECDHAAAGPATFAATAEYRWLREHAHRFGFRESYPGGAGLPHAEPWHWRHTGSPSPASQPDPARGSVSDLRVRQRRELADERSGDEHESEGDLVEVT